jgi:CRP/FNR family transcriptional regulator
MTLPSPLAVDCTQCTARSHCLSSALPALTLNDYEELIAFRKPLRRHQQLMTRDAPFEHLYAISDGQIKTETTAPDGSVHVTGLYLPGEVLGLESLGAGRYTADAIALCDSTVCAIHYRDLTALMARESDLLSRFHALCGAQLARQQTAMSLLGGARAPQRIAAFLLELGQRHAALGESPTLFNLRMSREDLGSYLGLALESVSRVLTRFRADGLLCVSNRSIVLRDVAGLQALAASR